MLPGSTALPFGSSVLPSASPAGEQAKIEIATKAQVADVSRNEATRKIDLRIQGMSSLDA